MLLFLYTHILSFTSIIVLLFQIFLNVAQKFSHLHLAYDFLENNVAQILLFLHKLPGSNF